MQSHEIAEELLTVSEVYRSFESASHLGVRENAPVRDGSGTLRHATPARHSSQGRRRQPQARSLGAGT
jgi:hypothetical protein